MLTPERWQQAEEVLGRVMEVPHDNRLQALVEACDGDDELREEVASLLSSFDEAEAFIETPIFSLLFEEPDEAVRGRRVGPYRLERLLGHGGMGSVYLAERIDEFEKRVALKVLKAGSRADQVVRRFRHERQILAHLEHPNIAKLLDGGSTDDGLPYFVMEYVEGESIDRYCRHQGLTVNQRLELFRRVCGAVHLAHQNLVVHRDLKPSNILVGGDGEPKLLDFGIAKPLDPSDASTPSPTIDGFRPMTVAYASPEQVAGEAITTASDVYSLGVILYELLTGGRPYSTKSSQPLVLAQAIREEEPRRPSTAPELEAPRARPEGDDETEPMPSAGRRGRASARSYRKRLAGDLDSIVLMALRKEPALRYGSAEQLSEDIRRHLQGLPIIARKSTLPYQIGKFVRRHKLETAMGGLVFALILGFGLTAVRIQDRARLERERAEEVSSFLAQLFEAANPDASQGEDVSARQLLDRGVELIGEYRDNEPRLYAMLAATMGHVYFNLGDTEKARPLLEEAIPDLRQIFGGRDDEQLAVALNDLGAILHAQGECRAAERQHREALAVTERLAGKDSAASVVRLNNLATDLVCLGQLDEAETLYRRGLAVRERLRPPAPAEVSTSLSLLGLLLLDRGNLAEAENLLRRGLEIRRELYGSQHTSVARVLHNLAILLQAKGETEEAEEVGREALAIRRKLLPASHSSTAATATQLASLLVTVERAEEAERLARQALATFSPGSWRSAHARSVLGSSLVARKRFAEAEPLLVESYPALVEAKRECTRYPKDALKRLVDLYTSWQRADLAARYRSILEACER